MPSNPQGFPTPSCAQRSSSSSSAPWSTAPLPATPSASPTCSCNPSPPQISQPLSQRPPCSPQPMATSTSPARTVSPRTSWQNSSSNQETIRATSSLIQLSATTADRYPKTHSSPITPIC